MTALDAIAKGIEHAKAVGLTKPFDVAAAIDNALRDADFRIVRRPVRK
jgi:hypothetical protein